MKRMMMLALSALAVSLAPAAGARADLVVELPTIELTSTGSATTVVFDVPIVVAGDPPSNANDLAGYNLEVTLTAAGSAAGLEMGGIAAPPAGSTPAFVFEGLGYAFDQNSVTATSVLGTSYLFTGGTPIISGRSLARVTVKVAADARGVYMLDGGALSAFGDGQALEIPVRFQGGSITVTAVPEPASLALVGLGVAGLGVAGLARRRRAA